MFLCQKVPHTPAHKTLTSVRDREVQKGMWLRCHPGIQEKREDQLPWWLSGKESACQCRRHGFNPWSRKIPQATEHLSPRVSAQLCPTLCNPMDCSPPGSSVHGILQARILQWVAISSSRGIFLTKGSNPGLLHLLHWQVDSSPLHHLGIQLNSWLLGLCSRARALQREA